MTRPQPRERGRVEHARKAGRVHLEIIAQEADFDDSDRPQTRGDCVDGPRPCPWVSCKYNLYLDVLPTDGIRTTRACEPEDVPPELSCALDIADRGGASLDDLGRALNLTRERARQIETKAIARVEKRARLTALRDYDDEGRKKDSRSFVELSHDSAPVERNDFDDAVDDDAPPVAISFFADAGDDAAPLNDPAWDRTLRADEQVTSAIWGMFARRHGIKSLHSIRTTEVRQRAAQKTDDDTKKENTNMDASTLTPRLAAVLDARNKLLAEGKETSALAIANLAKVQGATDKQRTGNVYNALGELKKKGFLNGAPIATKTLGSSKTKKLPPPVAAPSKPSRATSTNATVAALIEKRDDFRRKADALDVAIEALSEVL